MRRQLKINKCKSLLKVPEYRKLKVAYFPEYRNNHLKVEVITWVLSFANYYRT